MQLKISYEDGSGREVELHDGLYMSVNWTRM